MIKAKYYDGVTSVSHDAEIELWQNRIYIITAAGNHEWRYDESFVIERSGIHTDGKIGHDRSPEARLVFEDAKQFREVAAKLPTRKQQPLYKSVILYILSVALLIFTIFYIVPSLAPALGDNLPESWEARLGNYVENSFTARYKTCNNKEGRAALDKIISTLGSNSGSKYKFRSVVVNNKDMNALSAPGGHIIILSGLIDKVDNESELDGVLAHEMGHAVKRHGIDGLMRTILTTIIIDSITGGGGTAIYLGKQILETNYSRTAETEADGYALDLLAKTNINPQGLIDFFRKVQEEEKSTLGKYSKDYDLNFLSSHPATTQRMDMVKRSLNPQKTYGNILTLQEWYALKGICK